MRGVIILLMAAVSLAESVAAPLPPSQSKLSVHAMISYSPGTEQIIQAHPRVLKILDTGNSMLLAARAYKASTPQGKIVCRIYTPNRWTLADNPAAAGTNFWQTVLAPNLLNLSASDRALIDYVEGPNEGDSTPTWESPAHTEWYNTFWMHLAPLIASAGFKPLAFSIAVGNPPGSESEVRASLDRIAPALRLCQSLGGGWSYHAYSLPYSTNLTDEIWYSVRYRQYYSYFASRWPDLVNLPLVLTEGGIDGVGPWTTRGDTNKFQNWLAWFDSEMRKDAYCLGVTLFQIGDTGGWNHFNVEAVAPWIANHLRASPGGTNPPRLALAVMNGPSNVSVTLSDPANAASANNPANYWLRRADNGARTLITTATLNSGTNVTLTIPSPPPLTDYLLTVSNIGGVGVAGATPGLNGVTNVLAPLRLVGIDDITRWRYNAAGANLATAWRMTNYNDSAWPSGHALLGFESALLAEPLRTAIPPSSVITYYFRAPFHWPYTNRVALLRLRYLVDDGAVFYVDAREAHRIGISNNPAYWTNVASRTVSEAAYEGPHVFQATYLNHGPNLLAAEVHQVNSTSSDMVFGATLEALVPPSALAEAQPVLLHQRTSQLSLSWTNSSFALESAPDLTGPWSPISQQTNPQPIVPTGSHRFYRLRQ